MDFDFFNNLSADDAGKFLSNFLEQEQVGFASMVDELCQCGINTDFGIDNIEPVLVWISNKLKTFPEIPDDSLPDWIRNSSSYRGGLFSFDEASNILMLRGSYFLGESFVRDNSKLSWAVGDVDSAVKNMPVVTGFKNGMEMSPLMVLENVYKRIIADGVSTTGSIKKLIDTWKNYSP